METRYEEEGLKERTREIEKSIIKRFRKEIWRPFVKALNEYEMIQEGDQIAVCISGGKDSMLLAKCMQEILRHGKMEFGLKFLVMDPGYREENRKLIHENARILGIPIHVFETEIFDTVVDVEDSPCYLCARMRRGNLYANARELGCKGTIKPFSLDIHKGEVIGLTGLLGSGRSELVRAIYGADKPDSGELAVKGKKLKVNAPIDAMMEGMAYLPENRKEEGIIADLSVRENIIIALQAKKGMFKLMSRKEQEEFTDKYIDILQIKTADRETPIKQLSGGNQQKVILGRWLLTNPDFLILDEPTRGIDIGTKTEIQKLVLRLAEEGMAVVFISSEIEEMLRTCSRMAVMRDGEKVGELKEDELSQDSIMRAIAGGGEE